MKVGIIDADLVGRKQHRFPNLACMKLSSYYKSQGNNVDLLTDYNNIIEYDKVFISKVFTDTEVPDGILDLLNVEYGGTGFYFDKAPPLQCEVEHSKPDYDLYNDWIKIKVNQGFNVKEFDEYLNYSIGRFTVGCIRGCKFCVNQNYREVVYHADLNEFYDLNRKYICLLDDNIFAYKNWKDVFEQLKETGKPIKFKNGIDVRLLNEEKCKYLYNVKYKGDITFAFDNIKDRNLIENKLKLIRQCTHSIPKFYLLCAFNHDTPEQYSDDFWANDISDLFERIKILMKYKCLPYIMRYKDYEISPYRGMYITIARWCNQPTYYKKESITEYVYKTDGIGREDKMYASKRYLEEFAKDHPDIAKKYFHMKYEEQNQ